MNQSKKLIFFIFFIAISVGVKAQFGYGFVVNNDIYTRFVNPKDDLAYRASGSFLLNFGVGPKIWVGSKKVNLSLEGSANIATLSLAFKDYKGLGAAYFPIMAKINIDGLTTFDKEGGLGYNIGFGTQYFRTELFGLSAKYENLGVTRKMQRLYIVQAGGGFSLNGFALELYLRYGWNKDGASNITLGTQYNFNMNLTKNIKNPASEL